MTRRAKIVCTMGPATSSEEGIAALLDAGMNVARMNFSHGEHADHEQVHFRLRAAAKSADKALAILADLQGPKIRLGRFERARTSGRPGSRSLSRSRTSSAAATGCPPPTTGWPRTPGRATGC